MGFRVFVGDPIPEGPRFGPDNSSYSERGRTLTISTDLSPIIVQLGLGSDIQANRTSQILGGVLSDFPNKSGADTLPVI